MPKESSDDILTIDPLKLDEAWLEQPKLYRRFAEKLADAKALLDEIKSDFDLVCSELDRDIRNAPETYDVRKLTDKAVEAAIPLQKPYKAAMKELNEAKHNVGVLSAMVEALDHRKKALENLVYLHGQSYFSEPRAAGMVERTAERSHKAHQDGIRERRKQSEK